MRSHRVLMITSNLGIGGEELSTMALSRELIGRGHQVTWWAPDGPLASEVSANNIPHVHSPRVARGLKAIPYIVNTSIALRQVIEQRHIDIVHSHTVLPVVGAWLAVRKMRPRPRIVFHERGIHEFTYRIIGRLFNHVADFTIANSHYERAKLVRNGMSTSRCSTIHNCMYVDMHAGPDDRAAVRREWGIAQDAPLIGVVGRLEPEKGHSFLLQAALLLKEALPEARFVIVGGGPLESRLRKQCRSLRIEGRVVFAGFRRDLARVYAAIDVPVVPSLMEPFGNVALEAMAAGKPVVASAVGGLTESIVDGETGLLVPASDPKALACALASLVGNPGLARQLGEAGRKRVAEHFTTVRVADQVERVYEIITARQAAPPVSKVGPESKQEEFNEAAADLGTV